MDKVKVNIFFAKRNRNDYVNTSLFYLNKANRNKKFDVVVYLIDDCDHSSCIEEFQNIKVDYMVLEQPQDKPFRKSTLLNHALDYARNDFDWMGLIDTDMVLRENYFDLMTLYTKDKHYVVNHGFKLFKKDSQYIMHNRPNFDYIYSRLKKPFKIGPSQFAMSKETYDVFKNIFKTKHLYREIYEGWGAEDSELEDISIYLSKQGLIKRKVIDETWYHLYHEKAIDQTQLQRNRAIYQKANRMNQQVINNYVLNNFY